MIFGGLVAASLTVNSRNREVLALGEIEDFFQSSRRKIRNPNLQPHVFSGYQSILREPVGKFLESSTAALPRSNVGQCDGVRGGRSGGRNNIKT